MLVKEELVVLMVKEMVLKGKIDFKFVVDFMGCVLVFEKEEEFFGLNFKCVFDVLKFFYFFNEVYVFFFDLYDRKYMCFLIFVL